MLLLWYTSNLLNVMLSGMFVLCYVSIVCCVDVLSSLYVIVCYVLMIVDVLYGMCMLCVCYVCFKFMVCVVVW